MPNKSRMTFYCLNSFYVQGWLQSTELFRRAGRSRYGYLRDLFTDVSVKETVQPAHEWAWRPAGWGSRCGGDVLSTDSFTAVTDEESLVSCFHIIVAL